MSKTNASIRHGGPGSSHENAKKPPPEAPRNAEGDDKARSRISGGGGERDSHHTHNPEKKGGETRPARH